MKPRLLFHTLLLTTTALACAAQPDPDLAARFQDRLDEFHREAPHNDERLRVVYFHPADRKPQSAYQERLTRMIFDVRDFLEVEMRRNGFRTRELPLEIVDGEVVIHMVRGAKNHDAYEYGSGGKIRPELEKALQGTIDFANDFVLVFGGLCEKREDGSYFFHAPYYGDAGSNQIRGLCWAADGEMLDPRNLDDTKTQLRYEEHQGPFKRSMAAFNSLYLGGITHELGHGLSLPHNGEWPGEEKQFGKALMGSGNFTYRNQRWAPRGKGTFLTVASSLRLAAHPLFTGSDRQRSILPQSSFDSLTFTPEGSRLVIRGNVKTDVSPVGIIAYSNPDGGTSYDAKPWVNEVVDGAFEIDIERHAAGVHELELTVVHANGATTSPFKIRYNVDPSGVPDTAGIASRLAAAPFEQQFLKGERDEAIAGAKAFLSSNPDSPAADRLNALTALATNTPLLKLSDISADEVSLSDAAWSEAKVGWGRPMRNQFFPPANSNEDLFLDVGARFFEKGLYAHAPSRHVFDLAGKWKQFRAETGIQGGSWSKDGAVFTVIGDGKTLHTTKPLKGLATESISVNVSGVETLELVTKPAGKGNQGCWSIWAAPIVSR